MSTQRTCARCGNLCAAQALRCSQCGWRLVTAAAARAERRSRRPVQPPPQPSMRRKLVALPEDVTAALQAAADEDYPRHGRPGNVSAVVRDACVVYLAQRRAAQARARDLALRGAEAL